MPQIETWSRLPAGIRHHRMERMRDRHIGLPDLNQLRLWMETRPEVPEGPWFKDLGSFRKPSCFQVRQPPDANFEIASILTV